MLELGNVQNKAYNQYAVHTEQNRISNSQNKKASIKIENNDKAEATFKNSLGTETATIRQGGQKTNNIFSSDNPSKNTITGFREKVTAFRRLADEIINSHSLPKNIIKSIQAYIEEIMKTTGSSENIIYADAGEVLKKIRDEIQAINSSEKSLTDMHDKIVGLTKSAELNFLKFLEVEQKTVQQNDISELVRYSSSRIESEAQIALQCQANINPDMALKLLTS